MILAIVLTCMNTLTYTDLDMLLRYRLLFANDVVLLATDPKSLQTQIKMGFEN